MISERQFDKNYPDIIEYTLQSEKITVKILNLGVTITSITYPNGDDVVLGYDTMEEYLRFENYFGATIGRCANRIKDGKFSLHAIDYTLPINDAGNSLHGGPKGFHSRIFTSKIVEDHIEFMYASQDMEEGFPGKLDVCVQVELVKDTLSFTYKATSNMDTIINFTNHSYFALQGAGNGSVDHQILISKASLYGENDKNRLLQKLSTVEGTPFDFRDGKVIGKDITSQDNEQVRYANGYDHYMRFEQGEKCQVSLYDPVSKHHLEIESDLPGFQFYVPDYKEGHKGKGDKNYIGHCAVCLETSFLPDAINLQKAPETILKKDHLFTSETTYRFLSYYEEKDA